MLCASHSVVGVLSLFLLLSVGGGHIYSIFCLRRLSSVVTPWVIGVAGFVASSLVLAFLCLSLFLCFCFCSFFFFCTSASSSVFVFVVLFVCFIYFSLSHAYSSPYPTVFFIDT